MTVTVSPPEAASVPMLLPEHTPRLGPKSRRLLARLVAGLMGVQLVAAVLIFVVGGAAATAAGASLVFPGAGFLYVAWPLAFVVTLGAVLVALVLWWGVSAHLAIPLVWLVSAVVPALLGPDGPRLWAERGATWGWAVPVAYLLLATTVAVGFSRAERSYRAKRAVVADLNAYLADTTVPEPVRIVRPPDPTDIELLRWVYDLANQPDDGLDGLDWGDQFHSGTQLRYQLNALCWGLSCYAANFVPNALPQAEDALARLVHKHTDLRVWRYWRTLNVLGNFDPDPDPIRRDNIMFSGFLGDVLNVYEAATGSTRFDQPGSLTFVWTDGRTFPYDHHRIAEAVERNFRRSRLGFFACEPGWSFTVCNVMGAQTLCGHDRLHGTDAWDGVRPRWRETLDQEYLTPDGSYAHIRSSLVGLSWDTGEVPGGHYLAAGSNRFADILPDHARRAVALERRRATPRLGALAARVTDGRLDLELPATLERNRARRSALAAWNGVIGGARMLGEVDLALAALDASARQCSTGTSWPDRPLDSGIPGLAGHLIVRWSMPLGTADLSIRGYVEAEGPRVVAWPWDEVMVTEARSADGVVLDLGVAPRRAPDCAGGPGRVTLQLDRLRPGAGYTVVAADADAATDTGTGGPSPTVITADASGRADLVVAVPGPIRLRLAPEPDPAVVDGAGS
ncbi:MAG: hypothetical protein ACK5RL_08175 [Acidimicrobiales bacterium]